MDLRDSTRTDQASWARLICFLILPLCFIVWIGYGVATQAIFGFDQSILWSTHAFANPFLDQVAIGLSYMGGLPACMILLAVFAGAVFFIKLSLRVDLYFLMMSMVGSVVLGWSLKILVNRPRPDLWPRLVQDYGSSFPSGHSLYAATLATAFIMVLWPTSSRWPCVMVAVMWLLLMGVSRVYLGVHYPSDVLAGWALGVAWVSGVYQWMLSRGFFEVAYAENERKM